MQTANRSFPAYVRRALVPCVVFLGGCTVNNVDVDEKLGSFFKPMGVEGTFGMFDNSRGRFTIYNIDRFKERTCPMSTFKIVNAMIGLQSGRVDTDSTVIAWDGVKRERAEWNQDLSLHRAFQYSAVPHFQALARKIGRDTMQKWLDTLKYGNMRIGQAVDSFWFDNSLQISPDEQLGLVKKLYFRQLPFRGSVQESVKRMMIQENNSVYQLAYKSGLGVSSKGKPMAWLVGWIEENRHVYPFVLNIDSDTRDMSELQSLRGEILKDILMYLGFFQGKM